MFDSQKITSKYLLCTFFKYQTGGVFKPQNYTDSLTLIGWYINWESPNHFQHTKVKAFLVTLYVYLMHI